MTRVLRLLALLPALAVGQIAHAQVSTTAQTFPSLGMYAIQDNHDYGSAGFIARAAISDVVIVNLWNGWRDPGTGANSLQVLQAISAASTRGTIFIGYMNPEASEDYSPYPAWLAQVNSANWWVRTTYPSGALVSDSNAGGSGYWLDVFPGGPTGVGGRTYDQYAADYVVDFYYNGGTARLATDGTDPVNSLWSGIYQDSLFGCYQGNADYARTGASISGTCAQWSAGQLAITQRVQADKPGSLAFGNLSECQNPAHCPSIQAAYGGHFDGGDLENMVGSTSSIENQGLSLLVSAYQSQMGLLNSNQLGIFTAYNITSNGEDQINTTVPYQAARNALAICMVLGNARCDLQSNTATIDASAALWFDEDAVNRATQKPCTTPGPACASYIGYLGTAVDPPQTTSYEGCYWRRRFQYGEVWWSPASCSAGTINFGYTVNFIAGVQAPSFNTGGSGTTHPIGSRDGIIVIYQNTPSAPAATPVPQPPTGVSITK